MNVRSKSEAEDPNAIDNETLNDRHVEPHEDQADERGIPNVGRRKPSKRLWFALAVCVVCVGLIAFGAKVALDALANRKIAIGAQKDTIKPAKKALTEDAFVPPPAAPPGVLVAPPAPLPAPCAPGQVSTAQAPCIAQGPPQNTQPQLTPEQRAALEIRERRRSGGPLVLGENNAPSDGSPARGLRDSGNNRGTLGRALQATRMGAVAADQLANPNLTLTAGHLLPCTLETAISSDMPGMVSCVLSRDVYSTNNTVLLIERGSRVIGQYESNQTRQGLSRIFVLWTRVETPHGVLITLDSPATDALGRSGVTGDIDTHFGTRFGAAMLMSVMSDLGQYAIASQQRTNGGGTNLVFADSTRTASDATSILADNATRIQPTINVPPGASLGIFVARDVDFSGVYDLVASGGVQ